MKALLNYGDVANYILKYIEKTLRDTTYIPKGKKLYITSMQLKKFSEILLTEDQALKYLSTISKIILYEQHYNSIYVGDFHYQKLKVQKAINSKTNIMTPKHNWIKKT